MNNASLVDFFIDAELEKARSKSMGQRQTGRDRTPALTPTALKKCLIALPDRFGSFHDFGGGVVTCPSEVQVVVVLVSRRWSAVADRSDKVSWSWCTRVRRNPLVNIISVHFKLDYLGSRAGDERSKTFNAWMANGQVSWRPNLNSEEGNLGSQQ